MGWRRTLQNGGTSIGSASPSVRVAFGFAVAALTSNCSHHASPAAPTVAAASVAAPSPDSRSVTLKGYVTEAPPTATTGIWDARVTLSDGTTLWSSEKTIGGETRGQYVIPGLHPGRYEAVASADGYVAATRVLEIIGDTTANFPLLPVQETMSHTFESRMTDRDGTCSDGIQERPCRICAIPIHNAGPLDATLIWTSASPVKLSVTLFRSDDPTPLAQSTAVGPTSQHLSKSLPGGALYELRVTYASGTGAASYAMRVTYQN